MFKQVSVIICSLDRRRHLTSLLKALKLQNYKDFEVIVILGPSLDDTEKFISEYFGKIKIGYSLKPNISASRNIGLSLSSGEITAFIDDDAIPSPNWLKELVEGFDNDEVAAVGGPVYLMSPFRFQSRFTISNKFGDFGKFFIQNPSDFLNIPNSFEFPTLIGTNSAFRRDIIFNLNGFDENFILCLDEVDLCLRIIESGYIIKQLERAYVYHNLLPSPQRTNERYLTNDYTMIRSRIYFINKHKKVFPYKSLIESYISRFMRDRHRYHIDQIEAKIEKRTFKSHLLKRINRAYKDGKASTLKQSKNLTLKPLSFLQFKEETHLKNFVFVVPHPKVFENIIVSSSYIDVANRFISSKNILHIIYPTTDLTRIEFSDGIWIHNVYLNSSPPPQNTNIAFIDDELWRYSYRIYLELSRINSEYSVTFAISPINGLSLLATSLFSDIKIITDMSFHSGIHFSDAEKFILKKSCNHLSNLKETLKIVDHTQPYNA